MANNDQKSQARAKREAAQAAADARAKRSRNLQILAGVIFAAIAVVILVVAFSGGKGDSDAPDPKSSEVAGVEETKNLFAGVDQRGLTIGDADAPVTVLEFVDVQCPFCRDSFLDGLPAVINDHVKTGKIKLRLMPIALQMMGEDSEAGRAVLLRMARQNKGWNFANLFYFNQGTEATGYVTADYLNKLVKAAGGQPADAKRTPDPEDEKTIQEIDQVAEDIGVQGTPAYAVGKSGTDPAGYELVPVTGDGTLSDQLGEAIDKIGAGS